MLDQLLAMGATITSGQVDLNHVHVGTLQRNGSVALTPAGQELWDEHRTVDAADEAPKPRKPRKLAAQVLDADTDLTGAADE